MKEYLKMEQNISWCIKVMFVYLKGKIKEYLKMEQKFNNIYGLLWVWFIRYQILIPYEDLIDQEQQPTSILLVRQHGPWQERSLSTPCGRSAAWARGRGEYPLEIVELIIFWMPWNFQIVYNYLYLVF
jgi:hypothetical protein